MRKKGTIEVLVLVLGFCLLGMIFALASARASMAREIVSSRKDTLSPTQLLPDFVLDEFVLDPVRPRVNEPVTFTIRVRNAGAGEAPGTRVNLYIDPAVQPPTNATSETDTLLYSVTMPPEASILVVWGSYTFTISGCHHVAYAWADPKDDGLPGSPGIDESDEANNMRVIHVCVDPEVATVPGADAYEPDDTCSAAVQPILTDGTSQVRSFAPVTDTDYVKFDVIAGLAYTVTTAGTGRDADPNIQLSDSCDFVPSFGTTTRVEFTAPISGTLYLKLTNNKPNPDPNLTTYQLTVREEVQPTTGDLPNVLSINPDLGINDRNTNMVITGTQFLFPTMVELCVYRDGFCTDDCTQLLNTSWFDPQKLYAVVPPNLDAGAYCLQATNPGGKKGRLPDAFIVRPAQPDPREIVPCLGYSDASTDLYIYGFNFADGISMTIGSMVMENVKAINGTQVIATLPQGLAVGAHDLTAEYAGETPQQLADAFMVMAAREDLYAQDDELWINPVVPYASERMDLSLVVHRRGGNDLLLELPVRFSVNDTVVGDAIVPIIGVDGRVNSPHVPFTPTVEGVYTVTAVIDPDETLSESTRDNNTAIRVVEVLSAASDTQAPYVDNLTINGESGQTVDSTDVELSATAVDSGTAGVTEIRYVELVYNQGALLWVPVQDSHWLNYTLNHFNYPWTLTSVAGVHYIQVWVKDADGNISRYPYQQYVSYLPSVEQVSLNQIRVYRRSLAAGEPLHVTLTPLIGDPDLYIWAPDWQSGRDPWVSDLDGGSVDELSLVPSRVRARGRYQHERTTADRANPAWRPGGH